MQNADTNRAINGDESRRRNHRRAGCTEIVHVQFGGGPTEKESQDHLAGGLPNRSRCNVRIGHEATVNQGIVSRPPAVIEAAS